ncbi:MAG: hypothetical protein IT204_12915 [Fimbriimonadaceae bacterium]|nr:hypothetical protein [Fimbriimonadaceae bacterium]
MAFWLGLSLLSVTAAPRTVVDLSGAWELRADPQDQGLADGWQTAGGDWPTARVPRSWEPALGLDYDGVGWYRRRVRVAPGPGRWLLRLHGAATAATVWVGGREVASHLGAWTPFTAEVTTDLADGQPHELVVRLDERVGHNTQGFLPIIAPHFGGLWQRVELLRVGAAWFDDTAWWAHAAASGALAVRLPLQGELPAGAEVRWSLSRGGRRVASGRRPAAAVNSWQWRGAVTPWGDGQSQLYALTAELWAGGRRIDAVSRRIGFRSVTTAGRQILLNGQPLRVRGVLNWGYYPPELAPAPDPAEFRREVRRYRAMGFNLLKFCLWQPPRELLEVLDSEGFLGWIEYPTWHPKLDAAHRDELLREYAEFGRLDGAHPAVVVRSLTCETGPAADLAVLRALYDQAKAWAPETLVEDDSSWIGWNRIHDVWDDHSYGNNRWWRGQLDRLEAHVAQHGVKPLLLGEAIAADTWADSAALAAAGAAEAWWRPRCWDDQRQFEAALRERFGAAAVDDLLAVSRRYAAAMRRWQVETFTERLPDAGYVVSVARDFTLARMGLADDLGQPKWPLAEWAWHGPQVVALATRGDQRGYLAGAAAALGLDLAVDDSPVSRPTRRTVGRTVHGRRLSWELWALPAAPAVPPGTVVVASADSPWPAVLPGAAVVAPGAALPATTRLAVCSELTPPLVAWLRAGGRLLHLPGTGRGAWQTEALWWLRGTVWQPPQEAFAERLPAGLLSDLQLHELGGEQVIRGELLWEQVDPLLTCLETHDLATVRPNLLVFQTAVGEGRLLVSALRHGGPDNAAGAWLTRELAAWLAAGPAPQRALSEATAAALELAAGARSVRLGGPWRFAKDPTNSGLANGWQTPQFGAAEWPELVAGSRAEWDLWATYDGWGWYRRDLELPADWPAGPARLVFESVDDMYEVYVNGQLAGGHGRLDRSETSYLRRTWLDLGRWLRPGRNSLVVRVHDWYGGGGLGRDPLLTTGPVEPEFDLLRP